MAGCIVPACVNDLPDQVSDLPVWVNDLPDVELNLPVWISDLPDCVRDPPDRENG